MDSENVKIMYIKSILLMRYSLPQKYLRAYQFRLDRHLGADGQSLLLSIRASLKAARHQQPLLAL